MMHQNEEGVSDPLAIPLAEAPRTIEYLLWLRNEADQSLVRTDPDRYFALVDRGVHVAGEINAYEQLGDFLINRAWCRSELHHDFTSARADLALVGDILDLLADDLAEVFRMRCDYRQGSLLYVEGAAFDALRHLQAGVERARSIGDTEFQAYFHILLGAVHGELLGDTQGELDQYVAALRVDPGNPVVLLNLASCAINHEDWETARAYFEEASSSQPLSATETSHRFVMQSKLCWHDQDLDGALSWAGKAVDKAQRSRPAIRRMALDERALIHFDRGDFHASIRDLEEALELDVPDEETCLTLAMLAKCHAAIAAAQGSSHDDNAPAGDSAKTARELLQAAEKLLPSAVGLGPDCLREISRARKLLGDYHGALQAREEADVLLKQQNVVRIRSEIGSLRLLMKLEREEHERNLQKLRADNLQHQLASQATAMAAQVELIDRFRRQMTRVFHDIGEPVDALKKIQATLKTLPKQELDWTKLEAEFYTAHPGFRMKLLERYPELTAQQVRICLLIRLNLKTHEIAQLTSLSERNIEKHRLNIRKVMDLKNGNDLNRALQRIDE